MFTLKVVTKSWIQYQQSSPKIFKESLLQLCFEFIDLDGNYGYMICIWLKLTGTFIEAWASDEILHHVKEFILMQHNSLHVKVLMRKKQKLISWARSEYGHITKLAKLVLNRSLLWHCHNLGQTVFNFGHHVEFEIFRIWNQLHIYRVFKKTHLKEMCDFLSLKMLLLALALIKTKNHHLFDPLVRKC